ncbi:hypothetical protein ACFL5O_03920 [Myxococcota bacterium]
MNTADAAPVGVRVLELELSYAPSWRVASRLGYLGGLSRSLRVHGGAGRHSGDRPTYLEFSVEKGYGLVHEAGVRPRGSRG